MSMPISSKSMKTLFSRLLLSFVLIIATIYAKFTSGKVIFLLDYQNNVYVTVAYKIEKSDKLATHVYFINKIGDLLLNSNGTILNERHYIKFWLPYDRSERIEMILKYDINNFF